MVQYKLFHELTASSNNLTLLYKLQRQVGITNGCYIAIKSRLVFKIDV